MGSRTKISKKSLVFQTSFGPCTLKFSERGITDFHFGDETGACGMTDAPPAWVEDAVARVQRHLSGESLSFAGLPFDFGKISPFFEAVYQALLRVPAGTTVSYKELAEQAGRPLAARAVGNAMARNPIPLLVPCHRVLASGGRMGGYSGGEGLPTKRRLLTLEGATLEHGGFS